MGFEPKLTYLEGRVLLSVGCGGGERMEFCEAERRAKCFRRTMGGGFRWFVLAPRRGVVRGVGCEAEVED